MHLFALAAEVIRFVTDENPIPPATGEGHGTSSSSTDFLTNAPTWLKAIYVFGGGGSIGIIGLILRNFLPGRSGSHSGGGRTDKRAESNAERIDRYLDKAEADLKAAHEENDRLERQVMELTLQLQDVRDALSRSREAEAGARATVATLTDLLRELRDYGGTGGGGGGMA